MKLKERDAATPASNTSTATVRVPVVLAVLASHFTFLSMSIYLFLRHPFILLNVCWHIVKIYHGIMLSGWLHYRLRRRRPRKRSVSSRSLFHQLHLEGVAALLFESVGVPLCKARGKKKVLLMAVILLTGSNEVAS